MKRLLSIGLVLSMALGFTAFQCSSTEMTSAKLYIQQEKYDKAKTALEQELQKNPKNDEAYYLLGFVQGELKEYRDMLDNYSKSLEISQKFADKINQSKRYFWGNNFNIGVANFNRATKSTSADSISMFYDRAIKAFKLSILFEPDSLQGYQNIVFAFLNAGKSNEAIPYLQKIIAKNGSEDAYLKMGRIYFDNAEKLNSQGKKDEAMKEYNKAIEILKEGNSKHPDNIDILNVLSFSYLRTNRLDVALESFGAAVEKDPKNPDYRYVYGTLLLQNKDYENSIKQFEEALKIDPTHENCMKQLVAAYTNWGIDLKDKMEEAGKVDESYRPYLEKALPYAEKLIKLNPNSWEDWDLYGKVLTNLGRTEEAQKAYDKSDSLK